MDDHVFKSKYSMEEIENNFKDVVLKRLLHMRREKQAQRRLPEREVFLM